jgi:hypothetical protein
MPLKDRHARSNLTIHSYPSGHMVYLDDESRAKMKSELAAFYRAASTVSYATAEQRVPEEAKRLGRTEYRRRISRVRY